MLLGFNTFLLTQNSIQISMKKYFLIICVSLTSLVVSAQGVYEKPVVDERMELMGIIFRLAETTNYISDNLPTYYKEVDRHFGRHKNHPVVRMSESLVPFGVSFDAVADFAISLTIKNNQIFFNDKIDINTLDDRWPQDSIPKYLTLLNDFYQKTKFHTFFENTSKFRKAAEDSFEKEIISSIDFDWFEKFFRYMPKHKFRIIISLNSKNNNYGPTVAYKDGSEEYYAIMAVDVEDPSGLPKYYKAGTFMGTERILIHELCHSFCDGAINKYLDELLSQATVLYNFNAKRLSEEKHCGSPQYFLGELFVRASVFQYQKDHDNFTYFNVMTEIKYGFLGLPQLLECFERYQNDVRYTNLTDFMPEIVRYLNSFDFKKIYNEDIPELVSTSIDNNIDNVDYNLDSITLYFNVSMQQTNYVTLGINSIPKLEFIEVDIFRNQIIGKSKWNEEGTQCTFYFKPLTPDTEYKLYFNELVFFDKEDRYGLKNDVLTFKTRKQQ